MNIKTSLARYARIVCVGLILIPVLSCSDATPPVPVRETADQAAPDFSLKSLSGENFRLSSYKGKSVLLIFITTWCPSCRAEIPHYKTIYETYSKKGLEVAMIDIQESIGTVSRFASRHQFPFRILLDSKGDVSSAYDIVGVPAMILIDKDGKIASRQYELMDSLLESLVTKQ
jgi:peroxiredoxin